jgi:hypothetical protein
MALAKHELPLNTSQNPDPGGTKYADPDPQHYFLAGLWIRIHSLMLETNTDPDPDPDPIRIQGFNDQKLEKNYS